jgi:hypothetical protein
MCVCTRALAERKKMTKRQETVTETEAAEE